MPRRFRKTIFKEVEAMRVKDNGFVDWLVTKNVTFTFTDGMFTFPKGTGRSSTTDPNDVVAIDAGGNLGVFDKDDFLAEFEEIV